MVDDIVYMDPPYQGVCTNRDPRYTDWVSFEHLAQALNKANERRLSYLVSYDGRTADKQFGKRLPNSLELLHIELEAGRSSQATLLGRSEKTVESLYLSPALLHRLDQRVLARYDGSTKQLRLLEAEWRTNDIPANSSTS